MVSILTHLNEYFMEEKQLVTSASVHLTKKLTVNWTV